MKKLATWRILDRGTVPAHGVKTVPFPCPYCQTESTLPILGLAIALLADGGVVFDTGPKGMPRKIQCRFCKQRFELED